MLTEEQRNEMAEKIWAASKGEIENTITNAIRSEIRMDMTSRTKRLVASELEKLLRPAIEARMADLSQLVERTVQKMFDRVEEVAWNQLEASLHYRGEELFTGIVRAIVSDLTRGTNEMFQKRRQEVAEEHRLRRVEAERRAAEVKPQS